MPRHQTGIGYQLHTNMKFVWLHRQRYRFKNEHGTRGMRFAGKLSYFVGPALCILKTFEKIATLPFLYSPFSHSGWGAPLFVRLYATAILETKFYSDRAINKATSGEKLKRRERYLFS